MGKQFLTWQDIENLVDRLVIKIPRKYDAILAITRGGLVPACLISEKMDFRNIMVAAIQFYTDLGKTLHEPVFLQFPPDPFLYEQRILVVDDVWDSGRTVMAVKQRILQAGGSPEVAVLHYKPESSHFPGQEPEFYAEATEAWIVYPWDAEKDEWAKSPD